MTTFKELKANLQQNNGYSNSWKLIKEKDVVTKKRGEDIYMDFFDRVSQQTTKPLCQNIDLIVPAKIRTQNQQIQLEQFLHIIGNELHANTLETSTSRHGNTNEPPLFHSDDTHVNRREFERNDEKRQFRIQEFIKTEKSYVETLKTLVKYVVQPLRSNMQDKHCILNTFKCHKIFLNIDQITAINEQFLLDLQAASEKDNIEFGALCEKHIIKFECYRKYLLEQSEAQKLHAKEYKNNQNYRRFLVKVKDQSEFKRKRLQDILVEPVQRISRYSMMLREILQLTPEDHPDYRGLKAASEKAKEIATMADDNPTKTATMFLNLYQGIKDSPCSLINQKRSLVAHLDATEIHRVTNKPTRAVSLFLFTDKILVASRSSIDAKEIDLNELLDPTHTITPTSSNSASLLFSTKKIEKSHGLKFKGWADIESIDMFDGVPDRPGSFILSATTVQETKINDVSNITSFENYFYKGPRLFSVIPQTTFTRTKKTELMDKAAHFRSLYQKTRALAKQYEHADRTYHKLWKGVPTFCNVYNENTYVSAKYKNDTALIYVDDDSMDTDKLFPQTSSLFNPWIIGLIQPEDLKGFRFNICTRTNFPRHQPLDKNKPSEQTIDFESIFWNNLLYLDQNLKGSVEYTTHCMMKIQQAVNQGNGRTRTKSISRTSSIPTIGKLFNNNNVDNHPIQRRPSPSQLKKAKSFSPPPQPQAPKRVPVHHSWSAGNGNNVTENTSVTSLWSPLHNNEKELLDTIEFMQPTANNKQESDMRSTTEQQKMFRKSISRTISSIGSSDSSTRSSCSMIEDDGNDDDEEEYEIDYMTIKTVVPSSPPTTTEHPESLEGVFKSMSGFEDEMQQQWKAMSSKYQLLQAASDTHHLQTRG